MRKKFTGISKSELQMMQDADDEEEQRQVSGRAQLLMDCISDMIIHEGIEGMQKMVENGVNLHPFQDPNVVRGELVLDSGLGTFLYASFNLLVFRSFADTSNLDLVKWKFPAHAELLTLNLSCPSLTSNTYSLLNYYD